MKQLSVSGSLLEQTAKCDTGSSMRITTEPKTEGPATDPKVYKILQFLDFGKILMIPRFQDEHHCPQKQTFNSSS